MVNKTKNYGLITPTEDDFFNVEHISKNAEITDTELKKLADSKIDKQSGKGLSTCDFTQAEKDKLQDISKNANDYTHPSIHQANMIQESDARKFVSKAEKDSWNSLASQIASSIQITETEPETFNKNTVWLHDVGGSTNFSGGGVDIANAQTSNSPPITNDLWFEPI